MRLEIQKKGKIPAAERYKQILKKKIEDNRQKTLGSRLSQRFSLPGTFQEARQMSKRAEQALKEMAEKKAKKEAKALRQMVVIQPRTYHNGTLQRDGRIFDIAGNIVGRVNKKNGKMTTMSGWSIGKYKSKSYFTDLNIQTAINNFSPYFINLRKQQLMQQQGILPVNVHGASHDMEVINVHGPAANTFHNFHGVDAAAPRQNVAMSAWGVRSDNVWGSFTDNTWGTFADNVWGSNMSDVWGGIGAPGMWGQKGPNIWGTGNGKNYLRGVTNALAALFGIKNKKNSERLRALNTASSRSAAATRTAAAPTTTRR